MSNKRHHICRYHNRLLVFWKVLGINQIAPRNSGGIDAAELIKWGVGPTARRFDFHWTWLRSTRQKKIYLIVMLPVAWPCVVIQFIPGSHQHLGNKILIMLYLQCKDDKKNIPHKFISRKYSIPQRNSVIISFDPPQKYMCSITTLPSKRNKADEVTLLHPRQRMFPNGN